MMRTWHQPYRPTHRQETLRWTIWHVDANVYISEMKLLPREIKSNLSPRLQHLSPR